MSKKVVWRSKHDRVLAVELFEAARTAVDDLWEHLECSIDSDFEEPRNRALEAVEALAGKVGIK